MARLRAATATAQAGVVGLLLLLQGSRAAGLGSGGAAGDFASPERVTIAGYSGDAMEPFLSRGGRTLFFNDSNAPGRDTSLHWARRVGDLTFAYRGLLTGANSPALDAVPSLDRGGRFVFVSTRSYGTTLSTLYGGRFAGGRVSGVKLLAGVSRRLAGWVNFDAELSADGMTLYFVDGHFGPGSPAVPDEADLVIARRRGAGFARLPESEALLAEVNTPALEYAPAISGDGRELFFTRLEEGGEPRIFRAARAAANLPFDVPTRVDAADGFVEAPALSADGRALYYHRREAGGGFALYRLLRP